MAPSTTRPARVARIAFLDDDHVMRLARTILVAQHDEEHRWLRSFFEPEPIDLDAVLALGAGLRVSEGATAALASDDATAEPLTGANVLMFRRGRVTRELLSAYPDVRLVQRLGEDPSPIDLAAAAELGIEVSCLPRRTLRHAAEHVMALMLALVKQLLPAVRGIRAGVGVDSARPGVDGSAYNWIGLGGLGGLHGRTLGLVGCGEIGGLVARRAAAFGMRVLYTDPVRLTRAREQALGVEFRSLDVLLRESDIVSVHVPGIPANAQLIGAAEITRMQPGALLINTSRGTVVDEDALHAALVEGHIGGAGLDVHDPEPRLPSDRFCQLDNVVLTPHISGGSRKAVLAEIGQLYDNVRAVLADGRAIHGRIEQVT